MRMGKLFLVLVIPILSCSVFCQKPSVPELARMESSATIALIYPSLSNIPFCSAVFIDENTILTANHCIEGLAGMINHNFAKPKKEGKDGESDVEEDKETAIHDIIGDLIPKVKPKDIRVPWIVQNEVVGIGQPTAAIHYARVIYLNHDTDLALLSTINPASVPAHTVVQVATQSPPIGADVSATGHTVGLYWTFVRGNVSAYRKDMSAVNMDIDGPFLQAAIPIHKGNSGGGLFNEYGELIGISSFIAPVPNTAFFVHLNTIRTLLGEKGLLK